MGRGSLPTVGNARAARRGSAAWDRSSTGPSADVDERVRSTAADGLEAASLCGARSADAVRTVRASLLPMTGCEERAHEPMISYPDRGTAIYLKTTSAHEYFCSRSNREGSRPNHEALSPEINQASNVRHAKKTCSGSQLCVASPEHSKSRRSWVSWRILSYRLEGAYHSLSQVLPIASI